MGDEEKKDETFKERAIYAISTLPADATFEDIIDVVCLVNGIERGLREIEAGEILTQEEVKARLAKWLQ